MEKRLRVFAKWLSEYSEDCYDLSFTDEQIKDELEPQRKEQKTHQL